MTSIKITVHGDAQPAGSKKAFVPKGARFPVVVDANDRAKSWKAHIARACAEQYGGPFLEGAIEMELHFYQPRPKGHFGTGRNAGLLKGSAPAYPTTKPDVDKLSRAVLDGLTGQLYRDDSQVVKKWAEKHYGEPARVEIRAIVLSEQTIEDQERATQMELVL